MSQPPRILAFGGSLREASWNKKLVQVAAAGARAAGAEVTVIDLKQFPLPVYDEDIETRDGLPESAKKLKQLFVEHQGLLISSPEYNSSVTAALKNAIDWVSRPLPGEEYLGLFKGKVAGLLAASPGALGGLRGLVHLRMILGNIHVLVIPDQVAVVKAHEAFDEAGRLKDAKQHKAVEAIGEKVARLLAKLNG